VSHPKLLGIAEQLVAIWQEHDVHQAELWNVLVRVLCQKLSFAEKKSRPPAKLSCK